jgi:hypothetical protein
MGTQLFVIRGDHDFLMITVLGLGEPKRVAPAAAQIAKKALDRLPSVAQELGGGRTHGPRPIP